MLKFKATIYSMKTDQDGETRLVLTLDASQREATKGLLDLNCECVLDVTVKPEDEKPQ